MGEQGVGTDVSIPIEFVGDPPRGGRPDTTAGTSAAAAGNLRGSSTRLPPQLQLDLKLPSLANVALGTEDLRAGRGMGVSFVVSISLFEPFSGAP